MDYEANGTTVSFSRSAAYNVKNQLTSDTTNVKQGSDVNRSVTSYNYGTGASYALGNVVYQTSINYKNNNSGQAPNTRTDNTYQYFDGAVQATIRHDNNTGSGSNPVYQTTFTYDQRGSLTRAYMGDYYAQHVTFTNDENGQIIRRDESAVSTHAGSPHEVWYRYNGRQLGYTGNNGTADVSTNESIRQRQITPPTTHGTFRNGAQVGSSYADFAQSYDPLNSYNQGSNTSLYNVQAGDTLQGIAAQVYGDASLWYKIAQANGLSGSSALTQGQRLNLPAGVVKNTHNAGTFQPYNPAENIGDLTPTANAPPKKNKCGVFGQILLAVVAVAVTVVTAGTLGPVGAAVAGSAVSQGFGIATGIQEKFSFKGVALAALSAGVGAGVGDVLGKGAIAGSKFAGDVVRGAVSSAVTQGVAVATGLQSKFSFVGVAAAGIGAGAGGAISRSLPGQAVDAQYDANGNITNPGSRASFGNNLASSAADAIASAATRSALSGTSFGDNLLAAVPNAIGNTIGRAIGGAITDEIVEARAKHNPVDKSNDSGANTVSAVAEAIVEDADGPILEIDPSVALGGDGVTASGLPGEPGGTTLGSATTYGETELFASLDINSIPLGSPAYKAIARQRGDLVGNRLASNSEDLKAISAAQGVMIGTYGRSYDAFDLILFEDSSGNYLVDIRMEVQFNFRDGTDVDGDTLSWTRTEEMSFIRRFEQSIESYWAAVPVLELSENRLVRTEVSIESHRYTTQKAFTSARNSGETVYMAYVTKTDIELVSRAGYGRFILDSLDGLNNNWNNRKVLGHEFGHPLALADEYPPSSGYVGDTPSIMNNGEKVRYRHLNPIRDWVRGQLIGKDS